MIHLKTIASTVLVTVLLLNPYVSFSQPGFLINNNFGGSSSDFPGETIKCSEGGYIVVGTSQSTDGDRTQAKGEQDLWVVRLDDNCDLVWEKSFGSNKADYGCNIIETKEFEFIITGRVFDSSGDISKVYGNADIWVLKIDGSGNVISETTIGGSGIDICHGITATKDNGYLISAYTTSGDGMITGYHGGGDGLLLKLNSSGAIVWKKCLGGTRPDWIYSAINCADGGYIVTGSTSSTDGDLQGIKGTQGDIDLWLIKVNKNGIIQWQKTYGGQDVDEAYAGLEDEDGTMMIIGASKSKDGDVTSNNGDYDYWVLDIDKDGKLLHEYNYGGSKEDKAKKIISTNGGYIIIGTTKSPDSSIYNNHIGIGNSYDIWVVTIDTAGKLLNNIALGSYGDDGAGVSIIRNVDSSYTIVSSSDLVSGDVINNAGGSDYWAFKLGKWLSIPETLTTKQDVKIFPTYTSNIVHLENAPHNGNIVLSDISGKVLLRCSVNYKHNLDISANQSGLYILSVFDDKDILVASEKILKN